MLCYSLFFMGVFQFPLSGGLIPIIGKTIETNAQRVFPLSKRLSKPLKAESPARPHATKHKYKYSRKVIDVSKRQVCRNHEAET